MAADGVVDFESVARRVADRLTLRRAFGLANETVIWATVGAVLTVVLGRQLFPGGSRRFLPPLVLLGRLAGCALVAWRSCGRLRSLGALGRCLAHHGESGFRLVVRETICSNDGGAAPPPRGFGNSRTPGSGSRYGNPTGKIARQWWWLLLIPGIVVSGVGRAPWPGRNGL